MSDRGLPLGNRDVPGRAKLFKFHPGLDVGNEVSASASQLTDPYVVVLSTVTPRAATPPHEALPDLSTLEFMWRDDCGRETVAAENTARLKIVAAARALKVALDEMPQGRRALVHCAWGQNRSNAVCVAFAVLFLAWKPETAICYARACCCRDRRYWHPRPLHNDVFNRILKGLRPSLDGSGAQPRPTTLTAWLSCGGQANPVSGKRKRETKLADAKDEPNQAYLEA